MGRFLGLRIHRKLWQIVLTKRCSESWPQGDIKNVKSGYFRNYLFPNSLAVVATPVRVKEALERESKRTIEKEKLIKEAKRNY